MKYLAIAAVLIVLIVAITYYAIEELRDNNALAIACVQSGGDYATSWNHPSCSHATK